MRTYQREQIIDAGDYRDVYIYPTYKDVPKTAKRRIKAKPTTDVQNALNARHAAQKLTRLVHANFGWGDLSIGIGYSDKYYPDDEKQCIKDIQAFFKKCRTEFVKKVQNKDFKYIWILERGERNERLHFHIYMTGGLDRTYIEELWGKGYANSTALKFSETGIAGLAHYTVKAPLENRTRPAYRRWSGSKNLTRPQPKNNDYRYSAKRVRELSENSDDRREFEKLYPGYYFVDCVPFYNSINGGIYISIRMYKKSARIL